MTFDPHAYNIRVRRTGDTNQTYEATVAELPYVLGHGKTAQKAYDEAIDAITALHGAALEDQQPFPDPIVVDDDVSGRVTLRMSKTLHQVVSAAAHREGVSLNSYICETLAVGLAQLGRNTIEQVMATTITTANPHIGSVRVFKKDLPNVVYAGSHLSGWHGWGIGKHSTIFGFDSDLTDDEEHVA